MASSLSLSFYQTSDLIHDFACSPCKEDNFNSEAQFFCGLCKKIFCKKCVEFHSKLFRTHIVLGRQDVSKWVGYAGLSPIETCDKHGDKKLELLCEDHDELCCHICVSLTHRMCNSIHLISDVAQGIHKTEGFKKMKNDVNQAAKDLQDVQDEKAGIKKDLKESWKKTLGEIKLSRKKINDIYDDMEKQAMKQMHSSLQELDDLLHGDLHACSDLEDGLNTYLEKLQTDQDECISYIVYKTCIEKMETATNLLKRVRTKPDFSITFHSDPRFDDFIAELNSFWCLFKENRMLKVRDKVEFTIKAQSDKNYCVISGVCELSGGELLIADKKNRNVKLLDSLYVVTATCDLPSEPQCICHIVDNTAAVALSDQSLNILAAAGNTLALSKKLQFNHMCRTVSQHSGNIYIGSATAIFHYTVEGQLVKKLYEDNTANVTVNKFTMSKDGVKLYIPATNLKQLITIDTNGNILSTLQDPDIVRPISVSVNNSGHVFVCSMCSNKMVEVDKEGKHKLATLTSYADELCNIWAVWFTVKTHRLIIESKGNKIAVFHLK